MDIGKSIFLLVNFITIVRFVMTDLQRKKDVKQYRTIALTAVQKWTEASCRNFRQVQKGRTIMKNNLKYILAISGALMCYTLTAIILGLRALI